MSLSPPLPPVLLASKKDFQLPQRSSVPPGSSSFFKNSHKILTKKILSVSQKSSVFHKHPQFFKNSAFTKTQLSQKKLSSYKNPQLFQNSAFTKLSCHKNSAVTKSSIFTRMLSCFTKKNPQFFQELSAAAKVFSFSRSQGKTQVNTFLLQSSGQQ